jgi:nitrogen-specific signal transduction histidine kinase
MNAEELRDMKTLHLSFVGKIIAGFTHEIKNHFAIIKETGGLMQDFIDMGKCSKGELKQFSGSIRCIEEQIFKAISLIDYLNGFAHRMDRPRSEVNINEVLQELVALMTRFAYQKKIVFETDFKRQIPSFETNPPMLQYVLFCLIDGRMSRLDRNGRIMIRTSGSGGNITVSLISEGTGIPPTGGMEFCCPALLLESLKQLGGSVSDGEKEAVLIIPVAALTRPG